MNIEAKKKFIINFAFFLIAAAIAYFVMKYAIGWFFPFIIGFIVALIVQKPVDFLTAKTRLPRTFWAITAVILFFAITLAIIVLVCISIYNGFGSFANWVVKQMPVIKEEIASLGDGLDNLIAKLPEAMEEPLMDYPNKLIEGATGIITKFASGLARGIITYFPNVLLTSVITLVASCFTTVYYGKIKNFVLCQFDAKKQELTSKVKNILVENVLKMLGGYILILFITFLELFFGLLILKIPYAGIIALIIALFDILPVVGTGTILVPWFFIDLALGKTGRAIGILVIFVVITIVRNVIEPKIIGERIGLFPLVTLISMYVGLKLFGIYGMLLLPLAIVVLIQLQKTGVIHIWKTPEREEEKPKNDIFTALKNRLSERRKK